MPSKYTAAEVRALSDRELDAVINGEVMGLYPFDLDSASPSTDMNAAMEAAEKVRQSGWSLEIIKSDTCDTYWCGFSRGGSYELMAAEAMTLSRAVAEAVALTIEKA